MSLDSRPAGHGEPVWEIASLFPPQGQWAEGDYLSLKTNRLVELDDGRLEVLPMPTELHQLIVAFLFSELQRFVSASRLGVALFAPLRVRLREGKYREPDVVFMLAEHRDRRTDKFWNGADLVMEVVSEDDPARDWEEKRAEYAEAGIGEYWIVDPRDQSVTVLTVDSTSGQYATAGKRLQQGRASSVLLPGFSVDVAAIFSQS